MKGAKKHEVTATPIRVLTGVTACCRLPSVYLEQSKWVPTHLIA